MRDYYKISEISKLYGIGVDSLRYYEELGILEPRRNASNYRIYGLNDIYKLNIIRDLRMLDFSMQQIKEYLDDQCLDKSLALLHEEQRLIQAQIRKLQKRKRRIQERIQVLSASAKVSTGMFKVEKLPVRPCLRFNVKITRDEEMDFAVKKLHSKHEHKIPDFGNQLYGASVCVHELASGKPVVFDSVFFILSPEEQDHDFVLPEGDYLSVYYRGGYQQSADRLLEALRYIQENNLQALGSPFEIYEVDNRDTLLEEEFLTQIQIRVSKKE